MSRAWMMVAIFASVLAAVFAPGCSPLVSAAEHDALPEAGLEIVPVHFREKIRQARSHLATLLERREEAALLLAGRWKETVSGVSAGGPVRSELLLDGLWSYYPIVGGQLDPLRHETRLVPQEFDGPETAWYALRFHVPREMEGKRLYLLFEGVTLFAEVYVNGVYAGAHAGRFTPFEIDVTDAVRFGEENILHVLNGSAAVAYDRRFDAFFYQVGGTTEMERLQLTPGEPQSAGIWGSVTLEARSPVHVAEQFVVTSVRKGTLTVEVTVVNRSDQSRTLLLRHRVVGASDPAVAGPHTEAVPVTLPPGGEGKIEVELEWPDPILWELERPFLYWLVTEVVSGSDLVSGGDVVSDSDVSGGEVVDIARVRFGFREFWIEGSHFMLNGSKVRLMGESGVWPKWDPRPGEETPRPGRPWSRRDRPGVEALFRAYKEMNMTALRLHYRIGSRVEIEVADELGLLLIPQSGIWTLAEPYQRGGAAFFRNLRREFDEWIKRDRNSPAVVFWDVENEILRWGTPSSRPWAIELDSWVEELDRSRVILHSGGGNFGEQARAYSFHMAENYDPVFHAWSKAPDKPVILGEWWIGRQVHHGGGMLVPYGWTQTLGEIDPHHFARRERIEMHRLAGVNTMPFDFDRSLIYPVLPMSTGRVAVDPMAAALYRDAFSPLFVGLQERGATAVAGERLHRTAVVINDTPRDQKVKLTWSFRSGNETLATGDQLLWVPNGSRAEVSLELIIPQAEEAHLELNVEAGKHGEYRMSNLQRFDIFAPDDLTPVSPLEPYVVFDPEGAIVAWMERHGIEHVGVADLTGVSGRAASPASPDLERLGPVLIIGRNALETLPPSDAQALRDFVSRGGRALIMEQEVRLPVGQAWHHPGLRLPTPWLPNGLAFWSADISVPYNVRTLGVPPTVKDVLMSRYAAVLRSSHPVVQGLPSQLLAHWRAGDGRVVDDAIQLPRGIAAPPAGVTPLVGAVGPDNASLVEVTLGDGLYLINQLEITPNLDVDPAATRLFLNMLSYLEPQVLTIRPPLGLARGEAEIGIDLYTPRGWSLRSLRLRVDDEIWLETQAPVRVFPIDTFMLTDGDHQVTAEAEFETPSGSRMFRARGGIVVSNWRELHDDLEPPRAGWFGGLIKQLKTEEESAGWRYLQGESEWYFGDATRMAPGPAGVERLVWRMPRLQRAQVILYVPRDDVSHVSRRLTLAGSPDRERWTPLRLRIQPLREVGGIVELSVGADAAARLESGVPDQTPLNWFRLELEGGESSGSLQLGQVTLWGLR